MATGDYIAIFGIMLGLFITATTGWVALKIKVAVLQERISNMKESHDEFSAEIKMDLEKIFKKLDNINANLGHKIDKRDAGEIED